jgi:hypothetical protein
VVVAVYGLTLAPSLTWSHWGSDGGDFVTAAVSGRVPHPPGFPLYLAVARLAVRLASGDPARVLNVLSALAALGAVLSAAAALRDRGVGGWAAASAALALAFSAWFWSQALITEVYTTAACLVGWTIYLRRRARGKRADVLAGLGVGLAASVHPTALAAVIPVMPRRAAGWPRFLAGLALGLLPYAALPFFGPWPQPWGDLRTFAGWRYYVTARLYWGHALGLPPHRWPQRALAWAVLMTRQVTPVGALLILVGLRVLWRQDRREALRVLVTIGVVSLYAVGYNTVDSWVYLIAVMPWLGVALGMGMDEVLRRIPPKTRPLVRAALLLAPLVLIVLNGPAMDLREDRQALAWIDRTLDRLPQDAVVLTDRDDHTFALWYAAEALGRRPDLLVVNRGLWGYAPYTAFLEERAAVQAENPEDLARAARRPLCRVESKEVVCP